MDYLDTIREKYREEKDKHGKPLARLWEWAMAGKDAKERARRFEALSAWARKKEREADDRDTREAWDFNAEQYRKKYRFFEDKADDPPPSNGVGTFDGKPVAAWWVPILQKARGTGLWHGGLNSGYRSPAYSQQLCYSICGAPTCPGRCAGTTSNHTKLDSSAAVDVSDPAGFAAAMRRLALPFFNALGAADPWHFSRSGR
jgi:hypothetical protein